MKSFPINVSPTGAVLLGNCIACDGFRRDCEVRVQTHVHDDHMDHFETSKGFQDIYLSEATRMLLIAEFDADLMIRQNLKVLELGTSNEVMGHLVRLLPSDHMLGSVQVEVELPDGLRLGYSGDFHWPLNDVIQVDALVVDSTYGSPTNKREYSQGQAEEALLKVVLEKLKQGPVNIKAHRGTLQRALHVLSGNVSAGFVGSTKLCAEVDVYRSFGYAIDPIKSLKAFNEGEMVAHPYIRFYGKGDRLPIDPPGTTITLSAFMSRPDDPLLVYSPRSCRVALSNHADFDGTIEYIRASGAKYVVTDNTRGHGVELAFEVRSRLGLAAVPSDVVYSNEWGS